MQHDANQVSVYDSSIGDDAYTASFRSPSATSQGRDAVPCGMRKKIISTNTHKLDIMPKHVIQHTAWTPPRLPPNKIPTNPHLDPTCRIFAEHCQFLGTVVIIKLGWAHHRNRATRHTCMHITYPYETYTYIMCSYINVLIYKFIMNLYRHGPFGRNCSL